MQIHLQANTCKYINFYNMCIYIYIYIYTYIQASYTAGPPRGPGRGRSPMTIIITFHNKGFPYIVRGFFLEYGKGFLSIVKDCL